MNSFSPDEVIVFDQIDAHILDNKYLNSREKLQSWIWVYSNYQEKRFSLDDLRIISEHIRTHKSFFPELLRNFRDIDAIIKNRDKEGLLRKFRESLQMLETLSHLEDLTN